MIDNFVKRYVSQREKLKVRARLLYAEGEPQIKTKLTKFMKIPKEFSGPSTTLIYGDRVVIMMYLQIPVITLIKSKNLSDSYRKHFEFLWKKVNSNSF